MYCSSIYPTDHAVIRRVRGVSADTNENLIVNVVNVIASIQSAMLTSGYWH